ncbi:hypothetical protein AN218_33690, partial [Streptomyces nanshensis]
AYTPASAAPPPDAAPRQDPGEVFARVTAHGDEHAIKLADTALDVAAWDAEQRGADAAFAAALRAMELIDPTA